MGRRELKKEENLNQGEQARGKLLKRLVGDGQKEAVEREKNLKNISERKKREEEEKEGKPNLVFM